MYSPWGHIAKIAAVFLAFILIVAIVVGQDYIRNQRGSEVQIASIPSNYLISGVPYEGGYTGSVINTDIAAASYSVLQYWGDDRFTDEDVAQTFSYSYISSSATNPKKKDFSDIEDFFWEHGYQTVRVASDNVGAIKQMISNGVPVMVSQKMALDAPSYIDVTRLLIGYSDDRSEFIFHDNNFGNNYKISYGTYNSLENGNGVLAIYPKESLKPSLSPELSPTSYPERLRIMDSAGVRRIQIWWVTIDTLRSSSNPDYTEIAKLWEKVIGDEGFNELHPAARMLSSLDLARIYTNHLNEDQKAIDILTDITVPLTKINFGQSFGEWQRQHPEVYEDTWWKTEPVVGIGVANLRLYESTEIEETKAQYLANATAAFQQALDIDPENTDAKSFFSGDYTFALKN